MSKDWNSPIYVFFRPIPRIEYAQNRHLHVFECTAGKCKAQNGRDVRRFLNKGDAKSTSNLRKHVKGCCEESVATANNTHSIDAAREVLAKSKLWDGSITAEFECIRKGKVTYSHHQHTKTEARYATYLILFKMHLLMKLGPRSSVGCQKAKDLSKL